MFFPRLRRHAKWMFVFLALVFGLGFVVFGIGAGGTGIGDILRGSSSSGAPSVSSARKKTEENPKDAAAWRDLATAYQTDGSTVQAIQALETYAALKPSDTDSLRELAGLYLSEGRRLQNEAQLAQLRATYLGASTQFAPTLGLDNASSLRNPISDILEQGAGEEVSGILSEAGGSFNSAVQTYRRAAEKLPKDPNLQIELAQAAEQANDAATAIAAYERFLELAPEDPSAGIVRDQLKRLKAAVAGSTG
jgi:Flp pilus assembly protein TadD